MLKVLDIIKTDDVIMFICDFKGMRGKSRGFKLIKSSGENHVITNFIYERFTQCFSKTVDAVGIATKEIVPDIYMEGEVFIEILT